MKQGFTAQVLAVVVVLIVVSTVAVPLIADNQSNMVVRTSTTLTNTGTALDKGTLTDEYILGWDSENPNDLIVNGNTYTVFFDANGGTTDTLTKEVMRGSTYGELPTATRSYSTFLGWFTSNNVEITATTFVNLTSNVTLYAHWLGDDVTVTFDANGGTVDPSTMTVEYGTAYGELPTPTYTGHIFGGWYADVSDPSSIVTDETMVTNGVAHTLTAYWTIEVYNVAFTTDGNGTVNVDAVGAEYGTTYTIVDNVITVNTTPVTVVTATASTGYEFNGWNLSGSGTITAQTTFMANFEAIVYTMTFSAPSPATVTNATLHVPYGSIYNVQDNVVSFSNNTSSTASLPMSYVFTGWSVAQGSGTVTEQMNFVASYEFVKIKKVACSTNMTWFITEDGDLYGVGYNAYGQQGDGTTNYVTTFTKRASNVADVIAAENSTWYINTDGELYGCGQNTSGQQGDGTTNNVTTFTKRAEDVVKVVNSGYTTWYITEDGDLYGTGLCTKGQQSSGLYYNIQMFTKRAENVIDVACSTDTTWYINTDGELYGCGANAFKQQGDGTTNNVTTFTKRAEDVASVSCSIITTWYINTDGELYGCGGNGSGQQGVPSTDIGTFTKRAENVRDVICTAHTTWYINTNGELYGCGANNGGQQGDGTTSSVSEFTLKADNIEMFVYSEYADASYYYGPAWYINTDGELYGAGYNSYGQLGGGSGSIKTFTKRAENIEHVFCSGWTSWYINTDGELYGCGRNNSYQQSAPSTLSMVTTFTQRGPPGSINIPTTLNPSVIHLNPLNPILPAVVITPISEIESDSTDFNMLAAGNDWMLATIETAQDTLGLALYYAGLTEPLVWDSSTTLDFIDGTCTVTNDGVTYTFDYDTIFVPNAKGKYTYASMENGVYVSPSSVMLGYARPTVTSGMEFTGTIDTNELLSVSDGDITVGTAEIEYEQLDYEQDVYRVTDITGSYTVNSTESTVTFGNVIVEKSQTVTRTEDLPGAKDIVGVIPIILVIGVMIAAVGMFVSRRM